MTHVLLWSPPLELGYLSPTEYAERDAALLLPQVIRSHIAFSFLILWECSPQGKPTTMEEVWLCWGRCAMRNPKLVLCREASWRDRCPNSIQLLRPSQPKPQICEWRSLYVILAPLSDHGCMRESEHLAESNQLKNLRDNNSKLIFQASKCWDGLLWSNGWLEQNESWTSRKIKVGNLFYN